MSGKSPDSTKVPVCILLISHFTRALEKPEKRGQSRRLQVKLQIFILDRKVAGSIPEDVVNPALILYPAWYGAYSVNLQEPNSLWDVWGFTDELMNLLYGPFTSEI